MAKLTGNDINGHTHFRFTYSVLYLELIWFDLLSAIILGDIVIKEGTIGTKMYFIQEGIVDIVLSGEIFVSFNLFSNFDFVFFRGRGQGWSRSHFFPELETGFTHSPSELNLKINMKQQMWRVINWIHFYLKK